MKMHLTRGNSFFEETSGLLEKNVVNNLQLYWAHNSQPQAKHIMNAKIGKQNYVCLKN